jgi:2-polyprenyl-3-methyl-5-hydroxy-6-metoxy-1,4-benzoquinol methylase
MYEIVEVSLASVRRLYDYHINNTYGADFSVKGFDRPWLISSRTWLNGERVLDVGAAYSNIPIYLQRTFNCEMWVADDFGLKSNESFWTRDRSPHEHIASHPEIKYVLERLGDPNSSLPENYFDVVYSLSALEHVPGALTPSVWSHMDRLLKPGGELIHAIDVPFPSNFGVSGFLKAAGFEFLFPILPGGMKEKYCRVTPRSYLKQAFPAIKLKLKHKAAANLSPINMSINPDILTESYAHGLNRIRKDGAKSFRYQREGSLLVHLKKIA